ncbi:hypothetical protein VC83_07453 [Pseudogymnoascus destructans]|uniref:Uncharacterized protein n=1 Tax=Pseudogymnoascus destructans TaxID=655981 RepID=A0A177A1F5_9PEZI|nr:uncharacterized protein VC83_07453 [Pseudogymnoascus destructans]OAF56109.1 hypothetical protein VC83_07453 [Pseudogymnoascus destructans]
MFQPQLPTDEARAGLRKAMEDPSWAVGDFSGPNEYDWGFGGILVAGDNHLIRNRGCLIWSGAANIFWVGSLLLEGSLLLIAQLDCVVFGGRGLCSCKVMNDG